MVVSTMLLLLLVVTVCCDAHSELQHNGSRLLVTSDQPLVWSESNGYIVAPQGATVELTCRPVGRPLPPHTALQWWEEAPVMSGPNREVIPTQGCGVTLRLANITVSDYGRYRCKCVQKEHNFNEGIQFNLQWTQQCSFGEQLVTVLPSYEPTLWVPEVSRRQYQNRPGANARLQCHSQWNSSSTHWTVVTSDDSVRLSANGGAIRPVRNPRTDTKYLCHNGAGDHVYSIYYLSGPPPKAEIVFPPSDMDYVDIPYTDNELIESEGIIHLCLIQPYTSSSSIKYKSANNRTVSSTATTTASLSPSGALLLEAKLLSDGLLYFVRIMENKRDMDKVIRRTVEGGVFTCAVNKKNKVSFKLNLTAAQHSRSTRPPHEDSCYSTNNTRHRHRNRVSDPIRGPRFNSSRPVRPPRPENNTIPRIPKPLKIGSKYNTSTPRVPKPPRGTTIPPPLVVNVSTSEPVSATDVAIVHRGSIVTLLSIGGGLVMAIVIAVVIGLCAFRYIHRKQIHKMHKMSPVSNKSSLHSSFSNPLFNIIEADVPKTTILGKLQSQGLVYPFTLLRVCGELGSGAFGVVMQADLFDPLTQTTSTVAVKMLKDLATVEDERDLMMELKTLVRIGKHPNVLSFLGATINQGKLCLIVEYCEGGCLLELLRAKRLDTEEPLAISTMLEMASQIANGMAYLSSKKCLHRDLAARNVLITGQCTLKVGDFGLARKLYHSVYRPTPKRLPIKWMGPEGILDGVYTSKSDVWSFGVLLWEIFTLGRTPYPGIPTHSVIRAIQTGYRMLQPSACPDQVYNVMLCCWQIDPLLRPDFVELKTVFDSMFSEHTGQCYYNLQECDCSSESDYSLQEVDVDYVNVLPRGWFSSGDSVGVFMQGHLEENRLGARLEEGSLCSEFMQGHLKEEGSLCSECECNEPSDLISVNSQASLCTECELQELQLYTTS